MPKTICKAVLAVLALGFWLMSCVPKEALPAPTAAVRPGPAGPEQKPAGWEQTWNSTVAAAKKEGVIVLYTSVAGPSIREEILPAFKSKFGIDMELVVAKSDELTQKVFTERQRGLFLADAFITGTQMVTRYKGTGLLAPLEEALILPEALDPNGWPEGKLPFIDKDKLTLAVNRAYYSYLLVNTELVRGGLKSYRELVNPEWKGKLVMLDRAWEAAASTGSFSC